MSRRPLRSGAIAAAGAGAGGGAVRPEALHYPVATPPNPLGSTTALIGAGSVGTRFRVTAPVRVWSLRAYFPNTGYTINEMRIEDSAGTVLATTGPLTGVETIAATWVERDLTSYVELEPEVEYRVIAAIGEQYQHYYSATSPFRAPVMMLGGFRAGSSSYTEGLGWVDLGYGPVSEPQALIQYGSVSVSSLAAGGKTYGSRFTVSGAGLPLLSYGADVAIATNHSVRVQLWAVNGAALLADVEATGVATTWVRVAWPEPIQLNSGEQYRCVVAGTVDNWRYAQGVDPVVDPRISFHGWAQGLNWAYPSATGTGHFGLAIPTV